MRNTVYDDAAAALWENTQIDWHARVRIVLTEPVCAVVSLRSDDPDKFPGLDGFIGTGDVNESIKLACEHLLTKLAK